MASIDGSKITENIMLAKLNNSKLNHVKFEQKKKIHHHSRLIVEGLEALPCMVRPKSLVYL